jgi:hypothetical protein
MVTTTNILKQEPSVNTVSALMASAAIPLATEPILTSLIGNEVLQASLLVHQQSPPTSICVLLRNYLAERSDVEEVWMISDNKKTFQVTFYVEFGFVSDRMLQDLTKLSIGKKSGTKVFVLPTTIILKGSDDEKTGSLSSLT